MRKIVSCVTLIIFFLCISVPAGASDAGLREKIARAMEDQVLIQVRTGRTESHTGLVTDVGANSFVLMNPVTEQKEEVKWWSVQEVKKVKALGTASKPKIDSWAGKNHSIRIELVDGSKKQGRVAETGESSFLLQDSATGTETRIHYEHVKKLDAEPRGQKVIRKVMIGVGIGLLATYLIVAALLSGD